MTSNITSSPAHAHDGLGTHPPALRLWPAVAAVVVQWICWVLVPLLFPTQILIALGGGVGCGLIVFLWWMFFSRAPWVERIGVIVVMIAAIYATSFVVDRSIQNAGQGNLLYVFSIPALSLALVVSLVVSRRSSATVRRAAIAIGILLACASFTLLRTGGITGDAQSDMHWRWTPTPEERLLAQSKDERL